MKKFKFLFWGAFLIFGCGGENTKTKALLQISSDLSLEIVDGDQQSQLPNTSFVRNLRVKFTQASTQKPLDGIAIQFVLASGDAILGSSESVTNASGLAHITVESKQTLGEINIQAFPEGLSPSETQKALVVFTLHVVKTRTARLIPTDLKALEQTAVVSNVFPRPLSVKAVDADGLALPGEQIAFNYDSTQANIDFLSFDRVTSVDGKAQATVRMGTISGEISVHALLLINGLTNSDQIVTFQLTGSADSPFNIFPVSGHVENGLKVCVGEEDTLPKPIRFRVVDTYDNPVSNQSIRISAPFLVKSLNQKLAEQGITLTTNDKGEVDVNVQVGIIPKFNGLPPPYGNSAVLIANVENAPTIKTQVSIDVTLHTYLRLAQPPFFYGGIPPPPSDQEINADILFFAYGKCWEHLPSVKHFKTKRALACPEDVTTWGTGTLFQTLTFSSGRTPGLNATQLRVVGSVLVSGLRVAERDQFVAPDGTDFSIYLGHISCLN